MTKYGYNPAPPEAMEKAIDMALDDLTDAMVIVSPLLAKSAIAIMNDALHKKEGNL